MLLIIYDISTVIFMDPRSKSGAQMTDHGVRVLIPKNM